MNIFAHRETRHWLCPRHPIVCMLDGASFLIAVWFFVAIKAPPAALILPCAALLQYGASFLYHLRSFNKFLQTIDHAVIAILTAGTYLPFLLCLLPPEEAYWRIYVLCAAAIMVCLWKVFLLEYNKAGNTLMLLLGILGPVISFAALRLLPTLGLVVFLFGVAIYGLQMLVYVLEKPDPWPGLVGFREIQHLLLLVGSTIHMTVVLVYLSQV